MIRPFFVVRLCCLSRKVFQNQQMSDRSFILHDSMNQSPSFFYISKRDKLKYFILNPKVACAFMWKKITLLDLCTATLNACAAGSEMHSCSLTHTFSEKDRQKLQGSRLQVVTPRSLSETCFQPHQTSVTPFT